ncbi:YncE family protein [Candidatus Venteria ishoeyi]|uniref:Uncharacterized protein n=1 Tax=Candidatus Venteria ishoeyi TaxID=1899563 RepID=A0A1H6FH03_9GAMM|nr:YncE family protein [Candidatus Venteria ishoeyi]SEH08639.1 Uncharacterised protein [Candidatus Venteria ishoeyi]
MFIRYFSLIFLLMISFPHVSFALECSRNLIDEGQYLLDTPGRMALRDDGKYAFVLDTSAGNINIISTAEKEILRSITISTDELTGIAINTTQQRLYISEYFSGNLHIINIQGEAADFYLESSLTLDASGLGAMVYDEKMQRLFVADSGDNILVLDENLSQVSKIPAIQGGQLIYELLISNDKLFASFETGGVLGVYDITQTAPSLITRVAVESGSTGLAAVPGTNKIYLAHTQSNKLSIINTDTQVVLKTFPDSKDILSNPIGLAYLNGHIWTANQSTDTLIPVDTEITDVLSTECSVGSRPRYLLPSHDNKLYVSHSQGVDEIIVSGQASFTTWIKGASSPFLSTLAEPEASLDILIEGGVGPFTITTMAGMKAEATSTDKRQWTLTAPILFDQHQFTVRDDGNGKMQTRFIQVGSTPVLTPSGPLSMLLGQQELLSVDGGFPPYFWTTQTGVLSTSSGKQTLYVPRVTGADTLTIIDAMGASVRLDIVVQNELAITPLLAVMLPGEERDFQGLGSSNYSWSALLGGELSSNEGERIKFKAPETTGEYQLFLTDPATGKKVSAIIYVISTELKLTPAQINLERNASQTLTITGGHGPYTWTTEYGSLSNTHTDMEGSTVVYTAPKLATNDTLTVRDSGGRKTTTEIEITGSLRLSPAVEFVSAGGNIEFQLSNAVGETSWQASSGVFQSKSSHQASYTAPHKVGRYSLIASDDAGNIAQAQVVVTSSEITVSPAQAMLAENRTELFLVQGGVAPYSWSTSMGSLSSFEGRTVFFTAPQCPMATTVDNQPEVNITVEDGTGKVTVAKIQVTCSNELISDYDENNNQTLERTELYHATGDYLQGNLSDEQMDKEITLFFLTLP